MNSCGGPVEQGWANLSHLLLGPVVEKCQLGNLRPGSSTQLSSNQSEYCNLCKSLPSQRYTLFIYKTGTQLHSSDHKAVGSAAHYTKVTHP